MHVTVHLRDIDVGSTAAAEGDGGRGAIKIDRSYFDQSIGYNGRFYPCALPSAPAVPRPSLRFRSFVYSARTLTVSVDNSRVGGCEGAARRRCERGSERDSILFCCYRPATILHHEGWDMALLCESEGTLSGMPICVGRARTVV